MTDTVERLRELEKAASPGPWRQGQATQLTHVITDAPDYGGVTVATVNFTSRNATFLVALRNAAPALLDELVALRAFFDYFENGFGWFEGATPEFSCIPSDAAEKLSDMAEEISNLQTLGVALEEGEKP